MNEKFLEFTVDTTCCFFHSFLSGSVVVLQTLPMVWMNQLVHRNVSKMESHLKAEYSTIELATLIKLQTRMCISNRKKKKQDGIL